MYTITAAEGLASDDLWAVFSVLRLLDEAAEVVGAAGTQARRLVDDAGWENKGIRALRYALADLSSGLGDECGELIFLREQIARTVLA